MRSMIFVLLYGSMDKDEAKEELGGHLSNSLSDTIISKDGRSPFLCLWVLLLIQSIS